MSGQQVSSFLGDMNLSDSSFVPLAIKDEPPLDENYGLICGFTVTDLNDGVKVEIKEELEDLPELVSDAIELVSDATELGAPVDAPEKESRPRRTARRSTNTLSLVKKTQPIKLYTLDEIVRMTGRQLVQNFSEMSSNEMTKYFVYTCGLMPEICSNFFTSFGSEVDARNRMQRHIAQHVKDLLEKRKKDTTFEFIAESILCKALEEEVPSKREGRPRVAKEAPSKSDGDSSSTKHSMSTRSSKADSLDRPLADTSIQDAAVTSLEIIDLNNVKIEKITRDDQEISTISTSATQSDEGGPRHSPAVSAGRKRKRKIADDEDKDWQIMRRGGKAKKDKLEATAGEDPSPVLGNASSSKKEKMASGHKCSSATSWCLDHNYDVHHYDPKKHEDQGTIDMGDEVEYFEKLLPGFTPRSISELEEGKLPKLHFSLLPDENINPYKLIIPILTVPLSGLPVELYMLPNNPYEECDDIELPPPRLNKCGSGDEEVPCTSKGGTASEFEIYNGLDFRIEATEEEIKAIEGMRGRWTHDHIRLLSKYYLKELEESKGKARKKMTLCGCKICPNKKFTAVTTLYYHYVSHTGEKPFKCSRCDRGFTRRHSLNYHAMTHNNTNRFKCPVCLKQFRHTSHYKDHVRQHTGEKVSDCKICNTAFKSKTAFSRHLKSKHNVIITAPNKASRVMSPSKINQLHLQQEAAKAIKVNPVIIGTVGNMGLLSSIVGKQRALQVEMQNGLQQESERADVVTLVDPSAIKTELMDEATEASLLPPNVIIVQPEDPSPEHCSPTSMRRKPNILKGRIITQKLLSDAMKPQID